jgi:hypothetical protein
MIAKPKLDEDVLLVETDRCLGINNWKISFLSKNVLIMAVKQGFLNGMSNPIRKVVLIQFKAVHFVRQRYLLMI